jgi:hypothetical protein
MSPSFVFNRGYADKFTLIYGYKRRRTEYRLKGYNFVLQVVKSEHGWMALLLNVIQTGAFLDGQNMVSLKSPRIYTVS